MAKLLIAVLAGVLVAYLLIHSNSKGGNDFLCQIHLGHCQTAWAPDPTDPWAAYLAPATSCPGGWDQRRPLPAQRRAMACLLNYARAKRGLPALNQSRKLVLAAQLKSGLIVRFADFSHDPGGTPFDQVFQQSGYGKGQSSKVGENLGYGQDETGEPAAILDGWLNSPEHRQNLFTAEFRDQGLAVARLASFAGHPDVELWVSEFGRISPP